MAMWKKLALCAGVVGIAGAAFAQPAGKGAAQKVTGPIATYWMSAATQTGFGMPGMGGGGGRPSMSQIMGMVRGGGAAQHTLLLQLGSSQKAPGPQAEHLPPQGLRAGQALPLVTPEVRPQTHVEETPQIPREYQKPRGRMLIFWGCGEHAKAGQPIVIDFAQISAGKMPAGMEALSKGFGARPMQPPSPGRDATYGEWPNAKSRTSVPSEGSLVGDHLVQGNYSPEIKFALNPNQDFLGALNLTTNTKNPSGSGQLGWGPVSGAQAYLATAIGGGQAETVVMWTSSETQAAAFAMPDYISPGDLERLVASRALMSPQTTSCTVPKEVIDAAPQALVQLVAYGREANFVYPPRPSDPKMAWNQQWQVKVRYRSATGGMLGMTMPGMAGGDDEDGPRRGRGAQPQKPQTPEEAKAERRKAIMKGLGGALLGIPH
ncbi:MAG: hypothetical protein JWQ29_2682 [Phenylobacterium sp.]|nr:hypothetical protein [Phenylobacterium sp.]